MRNINHLKQIIHKLSVKYKNKPIYKDIENQDITMNFTSEEVLIKELDYFYTNSISRASKTMSECRQINQSSKKTGTDN